MNTFRRSMLLAALVLALAAEGSSQLARNWVGRFSGDYKNGTNTAAAMTADDSGNVYVAGSVTRKTSGMDFVTIKYTPDGELVWAAYYSNSSGIDRAKAVAVDSGFNVYVTGVSDGGSSGKDYATVKYDRNGTQLWVARYNGPGNGEDEPSAIAVNDSLNVYVTGWSWGGASTGFDFATVKYDAAGSEQWVARYNGPVSKTDSALAMALRGTSDLYVVGTSVDTMYDYLLIKYDPGTGDTLWTARYNGPANGNDIARAIALRSSSDVFITGSSVGVGTGYDYATIDYSSAGALGWVSRYNGSAGGDDQAFAIAVYSTSRVYVTGKSLNTSSYYDMVTVRYNQGSGDEAWVSAYNGPANDDDGGVAIFGGSNPYVLGYSTGYGLGKDYALLQYNGSNGNQNLSIRYNGPASGDDIPVAGHSGDGISITGSSRSGAKGSDLCTIRYCDQGSLKYRTFTQEDLVTKAVSLKVLGAVPNFGNIRDSSFARAYPKIKKGYPGAPGGLVLGNARPDSAGSFGWIRFDAGKAIVAFLPQTGTARGFDAYGGVIFRGEKKNPKLAKFNSHIVGELVALRINIAASDAEVTPPTLGDLTYDDGDTSNHFNGMTLRQLASYLDNYLTYWPYYPGLSWASLDSVIRHVNRAFMGPLKFVSKQPLVVTGVALVDSVFFLKPAINPVVDPLAFIPGSLEETPKKYLLLQNYPNPFNPSTTIAFELPAASLVTIRVYNMLGQEVSTLASDEEFEAGRQEVIFDGSSLASGVYFYRIIVNNGEYQNVKKMILVK